MASVETPISNADEAPTTLKEFHSQVKAARNKMDSILSSYENNVSGFYSVDVTRGNNTLVLDRIQLSAIQSNAKSIRKETKTNSIGTSFKALLEKSLEDDMNQYDSLSLPFASFPIEGIEIMLSDVKLLDIDNVYAALENKVDVFVEEISGETTYSHQDRRLIESISDDESEVNGDSLNQRLGKKVYEQIKRRVSLALVRADPLLTLSELESFSQHVVRLSISILLSKLERKFSSITKFLFGSDTKDTFLLSPRHAMTCHVGIRQWSKGHYGIGFAIETRSCDLESTLYEDKLHCTIVQGFPLVNSPSLQQNCVRDIFYDCTSYSDSSHKGDFLTIDENQGSLIIQLPLQARNPELSSDSSRKTLSSVISSINTTTTIRPKPVLIQQAYGWGDNPSNCLGVSSHDISLNSDSIQKGLSTPYTVHTPTKICFSPLFSIERISIIACSPIHTLLLSSFGIVYSCGDGSDGQLGQGSLDSCVSFHPIESFFRPKSSHISIMDISAGGDSFGGHSAAIDQDGKLYTWGKRTACGHQRDSRRVQKIKAKDEKSILAPTLLKNFPLNDTCVKKVACGGGFTIVLVSSNLDVDNIFKSQVFTFGSNRNGRLGLDVVKDSGKNPSDRFGHRKGVRQYQISPTSITFFDDKGILEISAGKAHALAVDYEGSLFAWGENSSGQCGQVLSTVDNAENSSINSELWCPKEVLPFCSRVKSRAFAKYISAGSSHSAVLDKNGFIWTWGRGAYGNLSCLGHGDLNRNDQRPYSKPHIARSRYGIPSDQNLFTKLTKKSPIWTKPRIVKALSGLRLKKISVGEGHSAAVTENGHVYIWGNAMNSIQHYQANSMEIVDSPIPLRPTSFWFPNLSNTFVSDVVCAGSHTIIISQGESISSLLGKQCLRLDRNLDLKVHSFPFYDCVVLVSGQFIPCHRAFVGNRCKVFGKMLADELILGKRKYVVELLLADIQYEVAESIIEYIYTNNLTLSSTHTLAMMQDVKASAIKFQMDGLIHYCDEIMKNFAFLERTSSSDEKFAGVWNEGPSNISLSENLGILMRSEKWTDVHLIPVTSDKIIKAHKFVLATRSAYFRGMIESSSKASDLISIEIPIAYASLLRLVQYLYTGIVSDLTENTLKEDLINAHHYHIHDLKSYCECELKVSTDNVLCLSELAHDTNSYILQEKVVLYLIENCSVSKTSRNILLTIIKKYPKYADDVIERVMGREHLCTSIISLDILHARSIENMLDDKSFEDMTLLSVIINELRINLKDSLNFARKLQKRSNQLLGSTSEGPFPWKHLAALFCLLFFFKIFQDVSVDGSIVHVMNSFFILVCFVWLYVNNK